MQDAVILVTVNEAAGQYIVFDQAGVVLLGPFFSHLDPRVVGQRLADACRQPVLRPDDQQTGEVTGWAFWPQRPAPR
jgi:hypothetical protein